MPSLNSKRAYRKKLLSFLDSGFPFTREGITAYLAAESKSTGASSIRLHIAVLRKLVTEAEIAEIITTREALGIRQIKRPTEVGIKLGHWLTLEGARELVKLPDRDTLKGKRDAALIALLLGCGLRREEAAVLTWEKYREYQDRMCLVNIAGKGGKTRTIPVPAWAQSDLDTWRAELGILNDQGDAELKRLYVLRAIVVGGKVGEPRTLTRNLTDNGVWWIISRYAKRLGIKLGPHDCRRSLAQLMRKNGAEIEQIQFMLGHASVKTTEIYLGGRLELARGMAAVDRVKLGREEWK
jgi:site-specific recombinase XerD